MLRFLNNIRPSKRYFRIFFFLIFFLFAHNVYAGESILYSQLTNNYWQIWMMDSHGQNKKQITFSKFDKRDPSSSQDGQKIIFRTNNGQLFVANLDGKDERKILERFENINTPHFSPIRNEVVFIAHASSLPDAGEIWISDLEGQSRIMTRDKKFKFQPIFSPAGAKIAFTQASEDRRAYNIWIMNADGTDPKQMTSHEGRDESPGFSADEKRMLFASNFKNNDYEIYLMSLENGDIKPIIQSPGLDTQPRFSSHDEKIVFVSTRSGSQQIWIVNPDGSELKQLTFEPSQAVDPSWLKNPAVETAR